MKYEKVVPDGGFGWKVALSLAFVNVFNQGLISVYGLLFGDRILDMGYGASSVAFVLSVNSSVGNFCGIFVGPLCKKFSQRFIITTAVLCSSMGMIISSCATTLTLIVIGYGLFTGIGLGLIQAIGFVSVKSYFTTKSLDAVAIASTGTSLGQVLMPQFINILVSYYGYSGATLILGGTCLNGLIASVYFDPVELHMTNRRYDSECLNEDEILTKSSHDETGSAEVTYYSKEELHTMKRLGAHAPNVEDIKPEKTYRGEAIMYLEVVQASIDKVVGVARSPVPFENLNPVRRFWSCFVNLFDLDLLKNFVLINILIAVSFAYTCNIIFSSFYPLSLEQDVGLDKTQVANCLTVLSASDIFARLLIGKVNRSLKLSSRAMFAIGLISASFFRSVLILQSSYPVILILCAIAGFCKSAIVTTMNLVIADNTPKEKTPSAVGMSMVLKAICIFTVGECLALLRDEFEGYVYPILIVNVTALSVIISWLMEYLIMDKCKRRENFLEF